MPRMLRKSWNEELRARLGNCQEKLTGGVWDMLSHLEELA